MLFNDSSIINLRYGKLLSVFIVILTTGQKKGKNASTIIYF
ncbi:MAG: hypothetical protein ACJAX4_002554 [Clostridium sp.]|jgi:hypothetical protein